MTIPFHKPLYDASDEAALVASVRTGHLVGDAEYTRRASETLAGMLGVRHVLLTTSCSHALELAVSLLRLAPGEEVIMPSFTFVSTANSVLRDGNARNHALRFFRDRGIGTTFHYFPLHLSPVGRSLGFDPADCPVTISASERLLRLPIYPSLAPEEQETVINAMHAFAAS